MQGVINIFGDIGVDVTLVDVIQQVKKQPQAESFIVNIDSPGGYVPEGFDIYDYLVELPQAIFTKGRGVVASIATVIFMAGDKRSVYAGTQFMIHLPYVGNIENAGSDQLDFISSEIKKDEKRLTDFYAKGTSIEEGAIKAMLRNETFLTEEQLFDLGFTTTKESFKIAAKLITKTDMNKEDKIEGNTLLQKIANLLKGDKVQNKILFSSTEQEVEFPDVADDANIAIGDTVKVDGDTPTDGTEITLKDGRTITVMGGKVESIKEEEAPTVEDKTLTTTEGAVVDFPDVAEDGEVKVGDTVTVDGATPDDGVITLSDKRVITIVDGQVQDISTIEEVIEEIVNLRTINKKMTTTLKEVEKFQSKLLKETPNPREERVQTPKNNWGSAINNLKKNK